MISPIFIIGSARSGTTFLGNILKVHKDVLCTVEYRPIFDYATKIARSPSYKIKFKNAVIKQIRKCYSPYLNRNKIYVDKSHQHILNVPILLEAFPKAKFIHIVRDSRDVITSMLTHKGVLSWFKEDKINYSCEFPNDWYGIKNENDFYTWKELSLENKCFIRWKSWVTKGIEAENNVKKNKLFITRYEKILSCEKEVKRLYSFIGVDYDPIFLKRASVRSIGRWSKTKLLKNPEQIYAKSRKILTHFGY